MELENTRWWFSTTTSSPRRHFKRSFLWIYKDTNKKFESRIEALCLLYQLVKIDVIFTSLLRYLTERQLANCFYHFSQFIILDFWQIIRYPIICFVTANFLYNMIAFIITWFHVAIRYFYIHGCLKIALADMSNYCIYAPLKHFMPAESIECVILNVWNRNNNLYIFQQ